MKKLFFALTLSGSMLFMACGGQTTGDTRDTSASQGANAPEKTNVTEAPVGRVDTSVNGAVSSGSVSASSKDKKENKD